MWRHGDVLISAIPKIPEKAKRRPGNVLARGELTCHNHRNEILPQQAAGSQDPENRKRSKLRGLDPPLTEPSSARHGSSVTLVEESQSAELYELDGVLYVRIAATEAHLVHEEHKPIVLPGGDYKYWFQREYTPAAPRRIGD